MTDRRLAQRRKRRIGRCRRCGGTRVVPSGDPPVVLPDGETATPVKPCSCVKNVPVV